MEKKNAMAKGKVDNDTRVRDGAHFWVGKDVERFLRKNFKRGDYSKLLAMYNGLASIDADFPHQRDNPNPSNPIRNLTKTLQTYTGRDRAVVTKYKKMLKDMGLVDYGRTRDEEGKVTGSWLRLRKFKGSEIHLGDLASCRKTDMRENRHRLKNSSKELNLNSCELNCLTKDNSKELSLEVPGGTSLISSSKSFSLPKISLKDKQVFASKEQKRNKFIGRKNTAIANEQKEEGGKPIAIKEWLGKWPDFKLRVNDRNLEGYIYRMRTQLARKKIKPDVSSVLEIVEYWNDFALGFRLNGHKIPEHKIAATRIMHLCQIIITCLVQARGHSVREIKQAIDNYGWILENSPWYSSNTYSLPQFLTREQLYDDCFNGFVENNRRYMPVAKNNRKSMTKEQLLDMDMVKYRKNNGGGDPSYAEITFMKDKILREIKEKQEKATLH